MVVRDATSETNTTADQEVAHDSLETCLTTLEIRASNQGALLFGVLDYGWVESVLRRTIQINTLFFDGSHAVENRCRERLVSINTAHKVIESVDLGEEEHLRVSSPQDDDFINAFLHVTDILSQLVNLLTVSSSDDVIGTIRLVCSDIFRIEGCR